MPTQLKVIPGYDRFTGRDGKILSDQFLSDRIQTFVKQERYEEAAQDHAELERSMEQRMLFKMIDDGKKAMDRMYPPCLE
jgi:hypothetical protein